MLAVFKKGIFLFVWIFLKIFNPEQCLILNSQVIPDSNTLTDYKCIHLETKSHRAETLKSLLLLKQVFHY